MLLLLAAACATALATGLGALPVYWLGARADALQPTLWGIVAGVMGVASVQGLLLPALDEGTPAEVLAGLAVGVGFLLAARAALSGRDVAVGDVRGAGARRAILVVGVLFVHSLPEGFALGTAWASDTVGLGLFVFLAIAVQNVPEGTATAIPLRETGMGPLRAFWTATFTSLPQPVGALAAFALVETVGGLLPASFGFAAGAMLALIVFEVLPAVGARDARAPAAVSALVSAAVMVGLGLALEVG